MAPSSRQPGFSSVIIVGAGPSGLLLALLLAQLSPRPDITILDPAPTLNESPRAKHYGPPAIQLSRKAGILAEIIRDGYMPLCALLERELKWRTGISVKWDHKVTGLKSGLSADDTSATLEAEEPGGKTATYTADYVVGCDGGNSTTRRLMHGQRNFPGFSWEVPIFATNTMIDLDQFGWEDTQFVIDPVHWFMAANIWRISYGEKAGLSNEELMERQEMKFEQMLPGHPKPSEYKILNKSPYRVHQRCVEKMPRGRVLLAADAAHLCNPFGGLGLTGGIVDVGALLQCFEGIHGGIADESILDTYCQTQRRMWHDIINHVSTAKIRRLHLQDPEKALAEDEILQLIKKAEIDLELSRELQSAGNELVYDYTQHYRQGHGDRSQVKAKL